jgi:hypothetical protein
MTPRRVSRPGEGRRTSAVAAAVGALVVLPACSSSPTPGAAPDGGDAGAQPEAGETCTAASSSCVQAPAPGQQCVTTMQATIVDPSGAPVAGLPVSVCGTNLCTVPAKTAADGTVTVAACLPFARPALEVFADPVWAPFAALLPGTGPAYSLGRVTVVPLPAAGAVLAAGTSASSGGVTLSLAPGTHVTFDVTHQDANAQKLRAVAVPAAQLPPTLAGAVSAAWGLAPLDTRLDPPAQLTVPNTPGWPAGAQVDFYLDGTDAASASPPAPWGAWGLVGTGAVSADGKSIALAGLPEIAMVGVKLH